MRYILVSILLLTATFIQQATAQSLAINTDGSTADASALLDVKSTLKGMLIPRMNKTERNAIAAPATGLLVFQNAPDSIGFYYYSGSAWLQVANSSNGWSTTGNAGTSPAGNFLGTTDNSILAVRTNNVEQMRLTTNGELALGTTTPNSTYGYAKMEIASQGFGAPADLLIRNAATSAGYAPGLVFQHARGTLAAPLTVSNGDYLSAISTMNYDGANYILSAGLDIFADGPVAANTVPTRMHFNTMNATGGYSARLTIKGDGRIGIGTTSPSAKLHVGAGTRFTVLDTGAVFLQSGNTIGSARDWKMSVTLPNGYLSFRDMGFDNLNNGMATDAMVIQWGTGNVGIGAAVPAARLDVGSDFKLGANGVISNALLRATVNIDVPSIAANNEVDITVTVTNANTTGSAVFVSPAADIEPGVVIAWVRVSAANTIKIRFRNTTGTPIDPAAVDYVISVLQ